MRDGTVAEPTRVPNAAKMSDWVGKFLAFQATPMREVAREIEETYGIRVVIEDSVIANRTVTGTFTSGTCASGQTNCINTGNTIDTVLAAMRSGGAYLNVHTDRNPNGELRGQIATGGF